MAKDTKNIRLLTKKWRAIKRLAKKRSTKDNYISGTAMLDIIVAEWLETNK